MKIIDEIETLVALLQPQADENTINFVIREILALSSTVHDLQPKKEIKPAKKKILSSIENELSKYI